ncbi:uncharacterized protein LY89DRAFT_774492 [Mollisia scopiformis]|uniref:Uncharacterized protein n=1 Tax=Mollisia scopiformis TaxID=149040 RepID=A0A194XEQ6_MOLSC|nr:uncharacterized protein LY89DRAFT_774492 [Mollisia scopiformis]KUJ18624.1 hypothetical protein LY89DRAFT_774492 [Mollisia scopiformis]
MVDGRCALYFREIEGEWQSEWFMLGEDGGGEAGEPPMDDCIQIHSVRRARPRPELDWRVLHFYPPLRLSFLPPSKVHLHLHPSASNRDPSKTRPAPAAPAPAKVKLKLIHGHPSSSQRDLELCIFLQTARLPDYQTFAYKVQVVPTRPKRGLYPPSSHRSAVASHRIASHRIIDRHCHLPFALLLLLLLLHSYLGPSHLQPNEKRRTNSKRNTLPTSKKRPCREKDQIEHIQIQDQIQVRVSESRTDIIRCLSIQSQSAGPVEIFTSRPAAHPQTRQSRFSSVSPFHSFTPPPTLSRISSPRPRFHPTPKTPISQSQFIPSRSFLSNPNPRRSSSSVGPTTTTLFNSFDLLRRQTFLFPPFLGIRSTFIHPSCNE